MAVTADDLELPLCVEINPTDLANKCGTTANSVKSSITHKRQGGHTKMKYIKIEVELEDGEEI